MNQSSKMTPNKLKDLRAASAAAEDDVLTEVPPTPLKPIIARTSSVSAAALKQPIGVVSVDLPVQRASVVEGAATAGRYEIGQVYDFPLVQVRESKYNARVYYRTEELAEMEKSFYEQGQLVPARGYFKDGLIHLVDGQKRYRAATPSGLTVLRVEVCEEPKDSLDHYRQSREINQNRSEQTAIDDAVRFGEFLEAKVASTHEELAKLMGMSQPKMTKTLAINKIPDNVLRAMREVETLTRIGTAYALSLFFSDRNKEEAKKWAEREADPRTADEILSEAAMDVIGEATRSGMSGLQVENLVQTRCEKMFREVQHRPRADSQPFMFSGVKGTLKTFERNGRLDLNIKGLSAEKLRELEQALIKICATP